MSKMHERLAESAGRLKNNIFCYVTVACLLVMLCVVLLQGGGAIAGCNVAVIGLMLLNFIIAITCLWREMQQAPFSLAQVHWVFYATFFSIAPASQYLTNIWPWGIAPTDSELIIANIIVLIWGIIFQALRHALNCKRPICEHNIGEEVENGTCIKLDDRNSSAVTFVALIAFVTTVCVTGIDNLVFRTESAIQFESTAVGLFMSVFPRGIMVAAAIGMLANFIQSRNYPIKTLFVVSFTIITCLPTALARFNVAAIYLGILIVISNKLRTTKGLYIFLLTGGLIVAYPILDAFKYVNSSDSVETILGAIAKCVSAGYSTPNYDAYSILIWGLRYIEDFGITYGAQLLGALLFFIPRSIWNGKPIPTGQLIFETYQYPFTDISCPLPCEGLMNFGLLGSAVFALIYALLTYYLDRKNWSNDSRSKPSAWSICIKMYYPVLLSLTFYMLRGALMNTMTFVGGYLAAFMAIALLISATSRKPEEVDELGHEDVKNN